MYRLARYYEVGKRGLTESNVQAREWLRRAAELGHVKAMGSYGRCLVEGIGGEVIQPIGLIYLGRAAQAGMDAAAFTLGRMFKRGIHGVPPDAGQARFWLRKVVNGEFEEKNLKARFLEQAKQMLLTLG